MRFHLFQLQVALGTLGLAFIFGCEQSGPQAQPSSTSTAPSKVTIDDVKRDAAESLTTTSAYSLQEKDKLVADMKAQLAIMDANIEKLRIQGKDLANDAKTNWELKMAALDEKRKLAKERLMEIGESSAMAWREVEAGVKSAWEELSKAFQEASNEF